MFFSVKRLVRPLTLQLPMEPLSWVPTRNCLGRNSTPTKSNHTPTTSVSRESVCPSEPLKEMDYSGADTETPPGEITTQTKSEQHYSQGFI